MKTKLIFTLLCISLFTMVKAQDCDTMFIFRNNNYVVDIPVGNLDTMKFALASDTILSVYKANLDQIDINTSYIDSITFYLPNNYIRDIEGNIYPTVTFGTQTCTAANLKTTIYNDGTPITNLTVQSEWLNTLSTKEGAYRWYNDDVSYRDSCYGAMYNWYTVTTDKLCPSGWHVPSEKEWQTFEPYLAATYSWTQYKATGAVGNTDFPEMQNKTRFNAVPAGSAYKQFEYITTRWDVWSTTPTSCYSTAYARHLSSSNANIFIIQGELGKMCGASVRCIKE